MFDKHFLHVTDKHDGYLEMWGHFRNIVGLSEMWVHFPMNMKCVGVSLTKHVGVSHFELEGWRAQIFSLVNFQFQHTPP